MSSARGESAGTDARVRTRGRSRRRRTTVVGLVVSLWAIAAWTNTVQADYEALATPGWQEPIDVVAIDSPATPSAHKLEWEHWGFDLHLASLEEIDGRARLRFYLELKYGLERAWTWIGFPRYRNASGRWHDAVMQGPLSRSRVVTASRELGERFDFAVLVGLDAALLRLAIDDQTLQVDLQRWLNRLTPGRSLDFQDRYRAVPPPSGPPGRPIRLRADLRWDGEKPFGDGALDAGESGDLIVDVFNDGPRESRGVKLRLSAAGSKGVGFPAEVAVPPIVAGEFRSVRVPFRGEPGLADATLRIRVEVLEPYGHDAAPIELELSARGAPAPELVLTEDFAIEGASLPIPRDKIVTVRLRVRNVGQGNAQGVRADISAGDGVFAAHDGATHFDVGDLAPGEVAELGYRCYANQRAEKLILHVAFSDLRNDPSSSMVSLPLESSPTVPRIVRVTPDPRGQVPIAAAPTPLTSDVDRFVPRSPATRPHGLAVVLGVEEYQAGPPAVYAADDARTAARYFEHALGIPAERIQLLLDAEVSLAQLQRIFGEDGWLARRMHEDSEVFVFFAGHGVADWNALVPYLIPADGDLNYLPQTAYPLDRMVARLAALDARHATVFLDACFSGLTREGQSLLDGARPLVIVPSRKAPSGVSLFSAAQGSELANALDEQGHGLFSYFLFKGLAGDADLDGDRGVTAGELKLYLEERVPRAAAARDREQSPSIFLDRAERRLVLLP
jgi:hypothetical protein